MEIDPTNNTLVLNKNDFNNNASKPTIQLNANSGSITAGGNGVAGTIILADNTITNAVVIDSNAKKITIGSALIDGNVNQINMGSVLIDGNAKKISTGSVLVDGNANQIHMGSGLIDGNANQINMGSVLLDGNANQIHMGSSILIDGNAGDVILQNADCAEDFEISPAENVEPGTVMALNNDGKLVQGKQPYDKRVAGVISGAGDLKPGLVLGRKIGHADRVPLALMGRVNCKVDAAYGSIEVGDLLTTSATPGHVMKATDHIKSFGSVIGKALGPLKAGCDLIPILVALQ